jgi:hypothetical protein
MGRRVPFLMLKGIVQGDDLPEALDDIRTNVGVSTFIDGESGGGVRIEEIADPLFDAGFGE